MYGICGGEFEIKVFFFWFSNEQNRFEEDRRKKILHVFA